MCDNIGEMLASIDHNKQGAGACLRGVYWRGANIREGLILERGLLERGLTRKGGFIREGAY